MLGGYFDGHPWMSGHGPAGRTEITVDAASVASLRIADVSISSAPVLAGQAARLLSLEPRKSIGQAGHQNA
jgi:hypothetical protein